MAKCSIGFLICTTLAVAGCKPSARSSPQGNASGSPTTQPDSRTAEAIADLNEMIDKQGWALFGSWDGKWIGTDVDSDVEFCRNGIVKVHLYGDAISVHGGTYAVAADGEITLHCQKLDWPTMVLQRDSRSLLLRSKEVGVGSDGRWPYRPRAPGGSDGITEHVVPYAAAATQPAANVSPTAELKQLMARHGWVTFRSYDGKWIGADFDEDLQFGVNGILTKTFYGLPRSHSTGVYTITNDGEITFHFPTDADTDPVFFLERDSKSLYLRSKGQLKPEEYGWPFRMIKDGLPDRTTLPPEK